MAKPKTSLNINTFHDLQRTELVALWVKHFGCPPPPGVRQPLLVRAAAWHLQNKMLGGLSSNAKRLLKASLKRVSGLAEDPDPSEAEPAMERANVEENTDGKLAKGSPNKSAAIRPLPLPGARLIRDWNGRRYVVEVVDGGFVMDGKLYKSLTAIAFRITGARWSGPRFFGL